MAEVTGGDGLERVLAALGSKLESAQIVRAGFLEGNTYEDGTPIAAVAAIQNFGAPGAGVPARPFFSNAVENDSEKWAQVANAALKATGGDAEKTLALVGETMAASIRNAIVELSEPELSDVTILLRDRFPTRAGMTFADVLQAREDVANGVRGNGSTKPLVWSGEMLNSVASEVK